VEKKEKRNKEGRRKQHKNTKTCPYEDFLLPLSMFLPQSSNREVPLLEKRRREEEKQLCCLHKKDKEIQERHKL